MALSRRTPRHTRVASHRGRNLAAGAGSFKVLSTTLRLAFLTLAVLAFSPIVQSSVTQAAAADLFFSEYVEGSSNNKAIEIYNGTGAPVDLSAYSVEIYNNGATSPNNAQALSGTLADGDVLVIANASANAAILGVADLTSAVTFFNGDDALVLKKNGVIIDMFGVVGSDPGSVWGTAPLVTAEATLIRKAAICSGDPNGFDNPADISDQWDGLPQNDTSNLGVHSANCGVPAEPLLLLSELVVTPTGGEFIEIHNPGSFAVNLSDVYLTDATFAGSNYYYNIVTGSNAGGGGFGDFLARFPDGASIGPGEYQTVALAGSIAFATAYGVAPTYELFEDDATPDGVPDMREGLPGAVNGQGGLTNDGEVVVLFRWDGQSDLVTDLDYALWGDRVEAVDKSGVAVDGPDADADASTYAADTAVADQDVIASVAHSLGASWQREDNNEGAEVKSGGNGAAGHDETSEDLSNTWCQAAPTPGTASVCPPPPTLDLVINEILADPDATAGDANGDGVVNTSQDEFVEIVNNTGGEIDLSGWTISDGFGVRHTFPAGTVLADQCAILVFGGGTPTGDFGGVLVQTASSGQLGLNNGGDSITLADAAGTAQATASYGGEGGNNQSLTLSPDITGSSYVQHTTVSTALFSPGLLADGSNFAGCSGAVSQCSDPATLVSQVQGPGEATPLNGQLVTIEALVVGDFQGSDSLNGFFVQEEDGQQDADPLTSEGIFVYAPDAADVAVGDLVRVRGQATEFNDLTELTDVISLEICPPNGGTVTPTGLTLPFASGDAAEPWEGMLVTFPNELTVTDVFNLGRYGEILLAGDGRLYIPTNQVEPGPDAVALQAANDLNQILLDDASTTQWPNPVPYLESSPITRRAGDTVTGLTGVLSYGFGSYRLQPTQAPAFVSANPRPAQPADVGGSLKASAFNVLNYFTTIDDGVNDARGADSATEFQRQQAKIVSALIGLDADVVGLVEIENNGYGPGSAIANLVDALNAVAGPGAYAFIDPGVPQIGTDAIAVGFIYQPTTVTPTGVAAILDSTVDPTFIDTKNRPALAQSFTETSTGAVFTAVVNHLKSKGSDCNDLGDPDTGDGQGNCNLTRTAAAAAMANWLAGDPTGVGDTDVLILGDLNAYALEDPVDALVAAGYTDLLRQFLGVDAYSYVFFGQAGYLDHALASASLLPQVTGVATWPINADESRALDYNDDVVDSGESSFNTPINQPYLYQPDAFRSSDHDPVVVGLNLTPPPSGPATVTIAIDVEPQSRRNFRFTGDLGLFKLDDPGFDDRDPFADRISFQVEAGTYEIQANLPYFWHATDITCSDADSVGSGVQLTVVVDPAEELTCTFTVQYGSAIWVRKYLDRNADGRPGWEPGLRGWEIILYDEQGAVVATDYTNGWGKAHFWNVAPGVYNLCETLTPGWTNTQPATLDSIIGRPCYRLEVGPAQLWLAWFGNLQQDEGQVGAASIGRATPAAGASVQSLPVDNLDDEEYDVSPFQDTDIDTPFNVGNLFLPLTQQ